MTVVTALLLFGLTVTFAISCVALVLSRRRFVKWYVTKEMREIQRLVFGLMSENEKLMKGVNKLNSRLAMREKRETDNEKSSDPSKTPDPHTSPQEWLRAIEKRSGRM